ncbi:hypothetical protein B0T26DRAFT_723104 [Lasiosphaeria miniovina]|uniref:Uncharacterized protein n=1 Tax=Lasiosphaeria miniovina TaxID=1954250 RepID=A0AA40A5R9_9PEZI|nr:uncharacterized protein B0T26DRAFT_723104 [Lasiosphaeria miniovina]KAK0709802.1 hypothetical protein B0T26DRAFT_723104 [Lasiosphaeria miniovina]
MEGRQTLQFRRAPRPRAVAREPLASLLPPLQSSAALCKTVPRWMADPPCLRPSPPCLHASTPPRPSPRLAPKVPMPANTPSGSDHSHRNTRSSSETLTPIVHSTAPIMISLCSDCHGRVFSIM